MRLVSSSLLSAVAIAAAVLLAVVPVVSAVDVVDTTTDGTRTWRTYESEDSPKYLHNISTFSPAYSYRSTTGRGMYGYNFIWRGNAYNAHRPLMIVLGSSISRCDDISDVSCVINKGLGGSFGGKIQKFGGWSKAILSEAGFGVLNIVSPTCYNTTRLTPVQATCSTTNAMHDLRHYRPDLMTDILDTVSEQFGFDTDKVVGVGVSMGARGIMRLGLSYKLRAITITGGSLEDTSAPSMQSQERVEGNYGEDCWSVLAPNFGLTSAVCTEPVETTMDQADKLFRTPVAIYASSNDALANLTTLVRPTCDGINAASSDADLGNMCTLRIQRSPYGSTSRNAAPPNHNQLCNYNMDPVDLNHGIKGYNGKNVTVSTKGNVTA
ncbi:hypothetical protein V8E36_000582 [Tilletia maclaganii]